MFTIMLVINKAKKEVIKRLTFLHIPHFTTFLSKSRIKVFYVLLAYVFTEGYTLTLIKNKTLYNTSKKTHNFFFLTACC